MSSEFGQFLDDLPDLNLPESKKPKRSAAYFINLRGVSEDIYKYLVQLDAWLDTPEKLSQWRAIVDAVLQRVQRYEKGKHKQPAKHPWPLVREPRELNLQTDEDLEALCLIVSLWHDHYTSGYPVLTAQQKETIRKWPYRPCSYGATVLLQWFVHLHRYVKAKGLVSEPIDDKTGDTPVTLREFMRVYCEPLTDKLLDSRVEALQRLARRKGEKIKLEHTDQWKPGQSKKFLPTYLTENWPTYKSRLSAIPNLKRFSLSSK
jgi:hypothetical protein